MRSLALLLPFSAIAAAQAASSSNGYTGYDLRVTGDGESAVYETANTDTDNGTSYEPPDVFLNASVNVGEISVDVQNLTAKINVDAQVLNLLDFGAGVDLSINRVDLVIKNVTAKVLLEARLGNLVAIISDVLDSIDLNPVIASLGRTVESIGDGVGDIVGGLTGSGSGSSGGSGASGSNLTARSLLREIDNILFSVNDYSGDRHRNRKLENNGDIIDEFLDNDGRVSSQAIVGSYANDFQFTGQESEVVLEGQTLREREYTYSPYFGLNIVSRIYLDAADKVVRARVISEGNVGGTSTISN